MIGLIIISVIFISVCSIAGYAIIQATHSVGELRVFNSEAAQVDKRINAILKSSYPLGDGHKPVSLIGSNNTDTDPYGANMYHHNMLPLGINLSPLNSWGRPVVYCPVSPEAIPAGYTDTTFIRTGNKENDLSGYNVGYKTSHDGNRYVAYSDQILDPTVTDNGVIAIMISPLPTGELSPVCQDVVYDSFYAKYSVDGGIVSVISRNDFSLNKIKNNITIKGADINYSGSINNMINNWHSSNPDEFVLDLRGRATPYSMVSDIDIYSDKPNSKKRFYIIGDINDPARITSESLSSINMQGIDLYLEGVILGPNISITINDGTITTNKVTAHSLEVNDSKFNVSGNTSILFGYKIKNSLKAKNSKIKIEDSTLYLSSNNEKNIEIVNTELVSSNAVIELSADSTSSNVINASQGSKFNLFETVLATNNTSLNRAEETAYIELDNSSIVLDKSSIISSNGGDLFLQSSGRVELNGSSLTIDGSVKKAIVLFPGSRLHMNNQSMIMGGVDATNNMIIDKGALFLEGNNSYVYGVNCFTGGLFLTSNEGSSAPVNASPGSHQELLNKSNWLCIAP